MLIVAKSARGHSPPKRHSASPSPCLSSLYRRKVTLCFSVTVLDISHTQLCFTSPWLSDSTHFISITTLLISFPLLCHSLPSHRLSTPFHRFTSHFNSGAPQTVPCVTSPFRNSVIHFQGPSLLRLRLTRQRYAKASQSFLCLNRSLLNWSTPSLYGVCYTTPALNNTLTVQIHGSTRLSHDSSKLCFSISGQCIS